MANANSRFGRVQQILAGAYYEIGNLQRLLGRNSESLPLFEKSLEILQSPSALAGSMTPDYQEELAGVYTGKADTLLSLGRLREARTSCATAVGIRERLVARYGAVPIYGANLAGSLRRFGLIKLATADSADAIADLRRALRLLEGEPSLTPDGWFDLASCLGSLSGLAGMPDLKMTAADRERLAGRALNALHQASSMGFHNLQAIQTEPGLAPLRSRDDFRLLLMDMAMPADSFAKDR